MMGASHAAERNRGCAHMRAYQLTSGCGGVRIACVLVDANSCWWAGASVLWRTARIIGKTQRCTPRVRMGVRPPTQTQTKRQTGRHPECISMATHHRCASACALTGAHRALERPCTTLTPTDYTNNAHLASSGFVLSAHARKCSCISDT